jgi:hypothetical protein
VLSALDVLDTISTANLNKTRSLALVRNQNLLFHKLFFILAPSDQSACVCHVDNTVGNLLAEVSSDVTTSSVGIDKESA